MAQVKIGDAHGLFRVFVGLVDPVGYNYGTAGSGVAQGTLVSPYVVQYAQDAPFALPDRTVVDFTGGDIWTGSYVYGITSLGTFDLVMSTVEADLIALTSKSRVDQTLNSRQSIFAENILLDTPPQTWVMVVFRLQSKEPGSVGANKFISIVMPRVWLAPKGGSGISFQSAATNSFTVIPTVGDRMPWGPLFCNTRIGLSRNQTPNFYTITDYPVHTVGYVPTSGNATEAITLPYKPVAFDYTTPDSSSDPVQVYINGTQVNADSITVENGQVVVSPESGTFAGTEYIGVFYETEYEPTVAEAC